MGRVALRYSTVLIALYLGVYYATGAGALITKSTEGANLLVHAFQGR